MKSEIKSILEKIEHSGFEAYVVGGFVRDYLLGIESVDVDICTNALPKDIMNIFGIKTDTSSYGSVSIKNGKYNFDITTYRKEYVYVNRKPQSIEYTSNLLLDIQRRDFTINALCMNKDGVIFDHLNGREDLDKHLIKVIGDVNKKLTEDPLRILRAIRFSIILNFDLDKDILLFISEHKDLLNEISYSRKKEELDKIFSSKNVMHGLNLLKELDILPYLDIDYNNVKVTYDLLGIWAQIRFSDSYPFTKNNLTTIKKIRNILEEGEITNFTLFRDGLYISSVAGEILGINKLDITEMYSNLKIKNKKDLDITPIDIKELLGVASSKIRIVYNDIISNVLDGNLDNSKLEIYNYIKNKWM